MTRVIETDEKGRLVLPAELLGEAKPHTRYTVEVTGARFIVEPEEAALVSGAITPEEWKRGWDAFVEQVAAVTLASGRTALEELTDMRNAREQGLAFRSAVQRQRCVPEQDQAAATSTVLSHAAHT